MRALLWIVLVASAVWGGYWWIGSSAVERGAEDWFAQSGQTGLIATRESLQVSGFPNRFDLTVNGIHLKDPASGLEWDAPFAQLFTMTWKPWHLIAALPNTQTFSTPAQNVTLTSTKLMGSLVLHPDTDLGLSRIVIEGSDLIASSDLGLTTALKKLVFSTTEDLSRRFTHRIGLEATGLTPDRIFSAALPGLPTVIDRLFLDGHILLTAPIDRHVAENAPKLTGIEVGDLRLDWGKLKIVASGSVAAASEGIAEGRIEFRIESWRDLPSVLVASGILKPTMAPTVSRALEILARDSVDPEILEVPLVFKSGRMSLGSFPLGPAPRLN